MAGRTPGFFDVDVGQCCEYLIKDRLSLMRFLDLGLADSVPFVVEMNEEALCSGSRLRTL